MKVYELAITLLVKKDIHYQEVNEALGAYINRCMLLDSTLSELHRNSELKFYHFSGLYPVESTSKLYQKGKVYILRLRCLKVDFKEAIMNCLRKQKDHVFQTIAIEESVYGRRAIQELYSVTPVLVTVNNGPWLQSTGDIDLLIDRLQANAEKTYKYMFQESLANNLFIQRIEFTNRKPIGMIYKGIKLLGNKVRIEVNSDSNSQKLAYTVFGVGLGEKGSSVGAGFCFANFI